MTVSAGYFLLNCRQFIYFIISTGQQYSWRCTSPFRWRDEIRRWTLARQTFLFVLQCLLIWSKDPRNSLFSSYCSFLVPVSILKHLDVSFSESRPPHPIPVNFKTVMVLCLGLGPSWSASSRPRCFRILTRLSLMRSWSWELSKSKTFSTPYARISALGFIFWVWGQSRGLTVIHFNGALIHPGFGSLVYRHYWD